MYDYGFLYLFSGFIPFVVFVSFIFFFVKLSKRVAILEDKVGTLKQLPTTKNVEEMTSTDPSIVETTLSVVEKDTEDVGHPNGFIAWLEEEWLLKLGAFLIMIGFAWLAVYALPFIGPVGRITSGLLLGTCITVFGFWRIKAYVKQGGIFVIVGVTAILLTLFAEQHFEYGIFNAIVATGIMFISTTLVAVAGVLYRSQPLALTSLIMSAVVPLMVHGSGDYIPLFLYLLFVVLSSLWVVFVTDWINVQVTSIVIVICYSMLVWVDNGIGEATKLSLLMFACIFAALFFMTNIVMSLRKGEVARSIKVSVIPVVLNAGYVSMSIFFLERDDYQAMSFILLALLSALASYTAYSFAKKHYLFITQVLVSLSFLGIATAKLLEGPALTIAFIVEIAACIIGTVLLTRNIHVSAKVSALVAIPIVLSFNSVSTSSWSFGIWHNDFVVMLLITVCACSIGFLVSKIETEADKEMLQARLSTLYYIGGGIYAATLVWLALHAGDGGQNIGTFIALTVYTLVGLGYYFLGKRNTNPLYTKIGSIVVGLVIARLILADVWTLNTTGRILTFFVIGALVMSTAFFNSKKE